MKKISVAYIGRLESIGEVENALTVANSIQDSFEFESSGIHFPLDYDRYIFKHDGYDLDRAIKDFLSDSRFESLTQQPLAVLTSEPYSEEYPNMDSRDPRFCGLYFSSSGYIPDCDCYIISTYIWERLSRSDAISHNRDPKRRPVQPYLLYCLAGMALDLAAPDAKVPIHEETRGCLNDYNHEVEEIDRFFGSEFGLCDECIRGYREALSDPTVDIEGVASGFVLMHRALGKQTDLGLGKCFISYGSPDFHIAKSIYRFLKRIALRPYFYKEDNTPGELIWTDITRRQGDANTVLILCSSASLCRNGFLREIAIIFKHGAERIIPISLDDGWRSDEYKSVYDGVDIKRMLTERNAIRFSDLDTLFRKLAQILLFPAT